MKVSRRKVKGQPTAKKSFRKNEKGRKVSTLPIKGGKKEINWYDQLG